MISTGYSKKAVPIDLYEEKTEMSCRQGSLKGIIGVKSRKKSSSKRESQQAGLVPASLAAKAAKLDGLDDTASSPDREKVDVFSI